MFPFSTTVNLLQSTAFAHPEQSRKILVFLGYFSEYLVYVCALKNTHLLRPGFAQPSRSPRVCCRSSRHFSARLDETYYTRLVFVRFTFISIILLISMSNPVTRKTSDSNNSNRRLPPGPPPVRRYPSAWQFTTWLNKPRFLFSLFPLQYLLELHPSFLRPQLGYGNELQRTQSFEL